MVHLRLLDIAPDPVGMGVVLAVILFVCAAVIVLAGALVLFLWYRKRSLRHTEMIRPRSELQANSPNQP
jgi:hypothetical protein